MFAIYTFLTCLLYIHSLHVCYIYIPYMFAIYTLLFYLSSGIDVDIYWFLKVTLALYHTILT